MENVNPLAAPARRSTQALGAEILGVCIMFHALLLLTLLSTAQIVYGTQTDQKSKVAQQVERVKLISGRSLTSFGDLPGLWPQDDTSPVQELI
jgi:hypothetical protein